MTFDNDQLETKLIHALSHIDVTILAPKAALEPLPSRFVHQGVQPACMKFDTYTGKQSF